MATNIIALPILLISYQMTCGSQSKGTVSFRKEHGDCLHDTRPRGSISKKARHLPETFNPPLGVAELMVCPGPHKLQKCTMFE